MHKGIYIASQILRRPWAIDPRFAEANIHIPQLLLDGLAIDTNSDAKQDPRATPYYIADARKPFARSFDFSEAPSGSIAVIPLVGPLMKEDVEECGMLTMGMNSIGRSIQEADDNTNISAIILYVDTPGGTVDGTQSLGDLVKSTAKPVVVFIDGLMASAGVWIGSQANYIIAENTSTEIGSIGVMMSFADQRPMWEKEGIKFHYIVPEESADKNKSMLDALNGDYTLIIETQLKPLVYMFRDTVRRGRGNVSDETMTGKLYFAEEALTRGLIDEIGSFQRAIDKASELSASTKKTTRKTKKTFSIMKYPKLSALLGLSTIEVDEENFASFSTEQLDAAEAALEQYPVATLETTECPTVEELQQQIATITQERDAVQGGLTETQSAVETANVRIAELETTVQTQQVRIEELEADPDAVVITKSVDSSENKEVSADPAAARMHKKFKALSGAE